jgi:hypothetical protein
MAPKQKQPAGPPMTFGNMRQLGVRALVVYCLNPDCRHETVINVDDYGDNVIVPWFGPRMVCSVCGRLGADVRPNWKEQSTRKSLSTYRAPQ